MKLTKALEFLDQLKDNNNRGWFEAHRDSYEEARHDVETLMQKVLSLLKVHDDIETPSAKKSMQRIYRDIRFSKDKTPYKKHFGGRFKRAGRLKRGGYYYHLEPANSFVVAAFWSPSKEDLLHIRNQLVYEAPELEKIVTSKEFVEKFGSLKGEKLKNAPKGFPKDHEFIDWLNYKQFLVFKNFSDEEVLSDQFPEKIDEAFRAMRPFLDFMSTLLTTDLNGEPLFP